MARIGVDVGGEEPSFEQRNLSLTARPDDRGTVR